MEVKELKPGDVLGRYQLLLPVAKGGMGQVWAARQTGSRGFQKLVAVKTIIATDEDAGTLEEMLFEEASLASQIRHPNVAQTLDLGEQEGMLYLVMEWVDGEPLDVIMRSARSVGGIPIAIAVHLIVQACKGMHAAHEAKNSKGESLGIVHRDISPQNLLVTFSGVVKLVDFGVAKATHQSTQPTALGQVKGKFAYMSPEQVQGEQIDARSDVFAMGIVLYRLTTGKHPFKSESPAATIHNILTNGPALPSELVPNYPTTLERVVMKALSRDKAERFGSGQEMMLALEQALPATVTANAEKNTERFLRDLFEKRIGERHAALAAAERSAQGAGGIASVNPLFPRSQSTMRAVSVESSDLSSSASRGQALAMSVTPAPHRWRWSVLTLVAAFAAGLVIVTVRNRAAPELRSAASFAPPAAGVALEPAVPVAPAPAVPAASSPLANATDDGKMPAAEESANAPNAPTSPNLAASPKKRDMGARRPVVPLAETPAVSARPAAPPPPPPKPADSASDGDPLNRRK